LRRWSYTWGTAVFFYAVVWLAVFLTGFILTDELRNRLDSSSGLLVQGEVTTEAEATSPQSGESGIRAVRAAWFSALAGGIGGVIGILYSLYWRVAIKQDFERQRVMYYAVQPIMGFVLGAIVYFIIGAGFLVINFASQTGADSNDVLSSSTVIALQIVTGWVAGFRQRFVLEMVDKIVQRFSSSRENLEEEGPAAVAPIEAIGKRG
jgi:hypothetical protein